ncbi:MAG: ATP-grasp domain-containing protein [Myxococcota bacterium]
MTQAIAPGGILGLLGGGQLGRMAALSARSLGYRVHALDPNPECPVRPLCERFFHASLDDPDAAAQLAASVDVVSIEREDIGLESLAAVERVAPLRPGRHVLQTIQNRGVQKQWLRSQGVPVGPFEILRSVRDLESAQKRFSGQTRFKAACGGFDGRGQWSPSELPQRSSGDPFFEETQGLIAEQELELADELSVLVARSPNGETKAYPAAHNFHSEGALETSVLPALLPSSLLLQAETLAVDITKALDVVGLLVVELFHTRKGELLVNELAPRPHNSFHSSEWACTTSQFEQLVRAVCGLPLGDVSVITPTAIANLYGDLWLEGNEERLIELLGAPGLHLRLYDKSPRKRRKLGHFACTAATPELALQRVETYRQKLWGSGSKT